MILYEVTDTDADGKRPVAIFFTWYEANTWMLRMNELGFLKAPSLEEVDTDVATRAVLKRVGELEAEVQALRGELETFRSAARVAKVRVERNR